MVFLRSDGSTNHDCFDTVGILGLRSEASTTEHTSGAPANLSRGGQQMGGSLAQSRARQPAFALHY